MQLKDEIYICIFKLLCLRYEYSYVQASVSCVLPYVLTDFNTVQINVQKYIKINVYLLCVL